jgi:hypothetical protein
MMRPVGARMLIRASVSGLIVLLLLGGGVLALVEKTGYHEGVWLAFNRRRGSPTSASSCAPPAPSTRRSGWGGAASPRRGASRGPRSGAPRWASVRSSVCGRVASSSTPSSPPASRPSVLRPPEERRGPSGGSAPASSPPPTAGRGATRRGGCGLAGPLVFSG